MRLPQMDTLRRLREGPGLRSLLKPEVVAQLSRAADGRPAAVLSSGDARCVDAALTGGKGSSLAILNAVRGVDVPAFFCVTTEGFRQALAGSREACKVLAELQAISRLGEREVDAARLERQNSGGSEPYDASRRLFKVAARLRQLVEALPLSESVAAAIAAAYSVMGDGETPVAVRSSATTEDTKDASFAGQHDTFLHQRGVEDVLSSVRKCWASVFTDRAVEYRNRNGIEHEQAVMSVVVQEMVTPAAAGTAFSQELSTGFPAVHISAAYGIGEAVVSGEVTADEWLVEKGGKSRIIKRVLGSKMAEFRAKRSRPDEKASGIELIPVSAERRARFCLESEVVKRVAQCIERIGNVYKLLFGYEEVDTEFALDEGGRLLMLQSRPVVEAGREEISTIDLKKLQQDAVICSGSYSLLGAVVGRAKVIVSEATVGLGCDCCRL